ncbi:1989_t:CDS:2, partial [Paraglomus occultum]
VVIDDMSFPLGGSLQPETCMACCKNQDQGPCESCLADKMVQQLRREEIAPFTLDQLVDQAEPNKRTMNSYIIFRKGLVRYLHGTNRAGKTVNGRVISLIATRLWKQMDDSKKNFYTELSKSLGGSHAGHMAYPNSDLYGPYSIPDPFLTDVIDNPQLQSVWPDEASEPTMDILNGWQTEYDQFYNGIIDGFL